MRRAGLALVLALAGCGGAAAFKLSSDDNDPARLAQAFAMVKAPPAGPVNATGKPLAFLVARGTPKQLIAFDLEGKKELWRVPAEVSSKVVIGRDFVASVEADRELVGRDVTTGKVRWRHDLEGAQFVGAAADLDQVYFTVKGKHGDRPVWVLAALDGTTGDARWSADSPGSLGAPAARGGLVFSPFLKQWLAILDARTGAQLTRIRGIDQAITFVRATPTAVYFGSPAGVFLLDERAASGKKASSTFGAAALPTEFIRVSYDWDAFDPIQAGYSAYDRNRILWRGEAKGDALGFVGDRVVVHTYRFFFGFSAKGGELAWAYSFPRVDVIGSAQLGPVIGFASMLGELGALDPASGRRVYQAQVKGQLLGVSFDAEGWAPAEKLEGESSTAAALAAIAMDRDARFNDVKKFAIAQLGSLPSGHVTADLLTLITSPQTQPNVYDAAVEALVARKDASGLADLVKALGVHFDFVADEKPRAVGVIARAIAAMGDAEIEPAARGAAVAALVSQLEAPETPAEDLEAIIRALGAVAKAGGLGPVARFAILYRSDPAFSAQMAPLAAAIDVLVARGGMAEREVVSFIAADPRTAKAVADYAGRALLQSTTAPATKAKGGG